MSGLVFDLSSVHILMFVTQLDYHYNTVCDQEIPLIWFQKASFEVSGKKYFARGCIPTGNCDISGLSFLSALPGASNIDSSCCEGDYCNGGTSAGMYNIS